MRSILKVNWDSNLPIYNISQSELQKKGINSLLLDVDGTLVNRKSNIHRARLSKFKKSKLNGEMIYQDDEQKIYKFNNGKKVYL